MENKEHHRGSTFILKNQCKENISHHLVWESLFLRLGAQKAFDEVLTSAALLHQVVLHLIDPDFWRGHDGKLARRILGIENLLSGLLSTRASRHVETRDPKYKRVDRRACQK